MNVNIGRAALAAALLATTAAAARADELNPQPLPPGITRLGPLSDGRLAEINPQHQLLLGATQTPAAAGRYKLGDGSIIVVGGKGAILSSTSPAVNRFLTPGSKAMLNPQPLPP